MTEKKKIESFLAFSTEAALIYCETSPPQRKQDVVYGPVILLTVEFRSLNRILLCETKKPVTDGSLTHSPPDTGLKNAPYYRAIS